jgi:DNA-directed RNA polymerase specialized sigma24 family protein
MNGPGWPGDCDRWINHCAPRVFARTYAHVRVRPHPDQQAAQIATRAIRDVANAARQRRQWPYFVNREEFCRWFAVLACRLGLWRLLHDATVQTALNVLPPEQQRILWWYHNDYLRNEEIADILRTRRRRASRLRRDALNALRGELQRVGCNPDDQTWPLTCGSPP